MDDRAAHPPWELAASTLGLVRTWVNVTFRPKAFVAELGVSASPARPALYAAVAVALAIALVAAAAAASTYSSLQRFGATESFGRIFTLQIGWYLGELVCLGVAASLSTWLVSSLARTRPAEAFRARMYTLGPLTCIIGWWAMYRWLEHGSDARPWRLRALALAGWVSELLLAVVLSALVAGEIRDAVFALCYE